VEQLERTSPATRARPTYHRVHIPVYLSRRITRDKTTYRDKITLLRYDQTLWTPGSVYPAPGSHNLQIPFRFLLPSNLPPSFYYSGLNRLAQISYSVEVVGHRPGFFQRRKRVGTLFPVVPAATMQQIQWRSLLLSGWAGNWRTAHINKDIRQGIWGQYSHVDVHVRYVTIYPLTIR
jgi:hypothetical protein